MRVNTTYQRIRNWPHWSFMLKVFGFLLAVGGSLALGFAGATEVAIFLPSFHVGQHVANIIAILLGVTAILTNAAIMFRGLKDLLIKEEAHTSVSASAPDENDQPASHLKRLMRYLANSFIGRGFAQYLATANALIESFALIGGLEDALRIIPGAAPIVKIVAYVVGFVLLPLQTLFALNEIKEMLGIHQPKQYTLITDKVKKGKKNTALIWPKVSENNRLTFMCQDEKGKMTQITDANEVVYNKLMYCKNLITFNDTNCMTLSHELSNMVAYHSLSPGQQRSQDFLYLLGVLSSALFGIAMGIAGGVGLGILLGGLIGGPVGIAIGTFVGFLIGLPTVLGSGVSTCVTVNEMSGHTGGSYLEGFKDHFRRWNTLRRGVAMLNGVGEGMCLYSTLLTSRFMQSVFKIPTLGVAVSGALLIAAAMWIVTRGFFNRFIKVPRSEPIMGVQSIQPDNLNSASAPVQQRTNRSASLPASLPASLLLYEAKRSEARPHKPMNTPPHESVITGKPIVSAAV